MEPSELPLWHHLSFSKVSFSCSSSVKCKEIIELWAVFSISVKEMLVLLTASGSLAQHLVLVLILKVFQSQLQCIPPFCYKGLHSDSWKVWSFASHFIAHCRYFFLTLSQRFTGSSLVFMAAGMIWSAVLVMKLQSQHLLWTLKKKNIITEYVHCTKKLKQSIFTSSKKSLSVFLQNVTLLLFKSSMWNSTHVQG